MNLKTSLTTSTLCFQLLNNRKLLASHNASINRSNVCLRNENLFSFLGGGRLGFPLYQCRISSAHFSAQISIKNIFKNISIFIAEYNFYFIVHYVVIWIDYSFDWFIKIGKNTVSVRDVQIQCCNVAKTRSKPC